MRAKGDGKIDYVFLAIVVALVVFGFMALTSASGPIGYDRFGDSYYFLKHQAIFGLIPGLAGMFALSHIPYTFWQRHAWKFLLVSIILLVMVFIPGLSAGIGTAHSWVSVGGLFSFQPSEIVKLTFLFYLAAWLATKGKEGIRGVYSGLLPFLLTFGVVAGLIILQPDVGTLFIIASMSLVVYFAGGAPISHILSLLAMGVGALYVLVKIAPYRAARLTTFLHPELDPLGIGYHVNQALLAIGTGGILGVGYGHSRQKFQYLPEVVSDSVFAVVAEEMGLIVSAGLIALFVAFCWRAAKIAHKSPDPFARLVVIGIAAWISLQAFVNIGAMVAILPITGVPLPFVSYGGTSLAVSLAAMGVILNISKYQK